MSELSGRVALVTGAAHGFGRAIAGALSDAGASVYACDVLADELGETGALCGEGCRIDVVDVTEPTAVDEWVRAVERERGRVDILVNNAGGVVGQVGRPLEQVTPDDWAAVLAVNLTATFLTCRAVAPGMKAAGAGRIVNISSGAGLSVSKTGIQAYTAAKAGQIGLTRQLAHELGPFGITVNNVAPGFVRSNPSTERQWESYGEEGQRRLVEGIALRRLGHASDIASAVLFLVSDEASWINGVVLPVDGGK